ncbi:MAG: hypothetical protein GC168_06250 [Candidatus Hydrogenedens sp.]|nr:hypothetical protein [Candidatus Hydrogenedens sp.]
MRRFLGSWLLAGTFFFSGTAARADGVDVDFDGLLRVLDIAMQAIADTNAEVSQNEIILLYGQDRDANGIPDQEQFAMLSAILMGNYTADAQTYGTNQLTPATVAAIQAGFQANKARANTDLTITGFNCTLMQIAGYSCNLIDLVSADGNEALGQGLLNFFAGYYTLGEAGLLNFNYNGSSTGQDFPEFYFKKLLELGARGTSNASIVNTVNSSISFNPSNYQRFGSAGTNYIGAAGDIDSNIPGGQNNGAEYTAAADREAWLNACHITPPLRVSTDPVGGTTSTGLSKFFDLGVAGGLQALGKGDARAQWSRTDSNVDPAVTTIVRAFSTALPYTIDYLTIPAGNSTYDWAFYAAVEDDVWKRSSSIVNLTVNLDTNFRITAQSTDGAVAEGQPLVLEVVLAGGNQVPTYAWFKDNVLLGSQTGRVLSIPSFTAGDAGTYRCEISGNTNGAKAATTLISNDIVVTVDTPAEGEGEGVVEGTFEGSTDGEGNTEGVVEGSADGEGSTEGVVEGTVDGEGAIEGTIEGATDGEGTVEGSTEGVAEGEGSHEGIVEGSTEGISEGEGAIEGNPEGVSEGEGAVEGEGSHEGTLEGAVEGEGASEGAADGEGVVDGEGQPDGAAEGEGAIEGAQDGEGQTEGEGDGGGEGGGEGDVFLTLSEGARALLVAFFSLDGNEDRELSFGECSNYLDNLFAQKGTSFYLDGESLYNDLNVTTSNGLTVGELRQAVEGAVHAADTNADFRFELSELLRVIQLANANGFGCALLPGDTEDGFALNLTGQDCAPHSADTSPEDWNINLSELLRAIQIYNIGGYTACTDTEDGACLD